MNSETEKRGRLPEAFAKGTGWPWMREPPVTVPSSDGAELPRVTIVTPSFNQGPFLEQTIRSVLLQGYPNLEYFVIDGGSTDGSVDIIRHYDTRLTYWESTTDRGQSHALAKGFSRATGAILGWVNSDDYLAPGALSAIADLRRRCPQSVAWVGACQEVDRDGAALRDIRPETGTGDTMADWAYGALFYQPACFFSADAYRSVGGMKETLHFVMDVDLWVRLAALGDFAATNERIACARVYPEAKTQRDAVMREAELIAVAVTNNLPDIARRRLIRYTDGKLRGVRNRLQLAEEKAADLEDCLWPASHLLRYLARRGIQALRRLTTHGWGRTSSR